MPEILNQNQTPQPEATQPSTEVKPKVKLALPPVTKAAVSAKVNVLKQKVGELDPKRKKIVLAVAILFAIIFLLLILNILASIFRGRPQTVNPTPTPTTVQGSPAPIIITNPSRYATDAGVLKIESDLNAIDANLKNIDPQHSQIAVPNLDFNIKFQ